MSQNRDKINKLTRGERKRRQHEARELREAIKRRRQEYRRGVRRARHHPWAEIRR